MKETELAIKGFTKINLLDQSDIGELRRIINSKIKQILGDEPGNGYIELMREEDPLAEYHRYSTNTQHGRYWTKNNRIFEKDEAEWFKRLDGIKRLFQEYKCCFVSDEEQIGYENFYWRITRPKIKEDVGPIHRDSWFWELNNDFGINMEGRNRIKVWIAIQTEPGLNGLLVQPYSHKKKNIEYTSKVTDTIIKPVLTTVIPDGAMELVQTQPGEAIVFDDNMLHGGSNNNAETCRCSMEFTMITENCRDTER